MNLQNQPKKFTRSHKDTKYRQFNIIQPFGNDDTNSGIFGKSKNFQFGDLPIYEKPLNEGDYYKFTDIKGGKYKAKKTPLNKFFQDVVSVCTFEK